MSPFWDPPSLAIVGLGVLALVAWLVLSPPTSRAPIPALLQIAAALLLLVTLVNAGWRSAASARPRLVVLLDRSASMAEVGDEGETRLARSREWLRSQLPTLGSGWRVEIDSFGGGTTDPAAAIDAAAGTLPEAILILSDGRASGGRTVGGAPVPLYAWSPGPASLPDLALLELSIEGDPPRAIAEVAAVGGAPAGPRAVALYVDGREIARAVVPALGAGERRSIPFALPPATGGERVVEARLAEPADPVEGNDARARVWRPDRIERVLVVGLAPGWELGFLRRALASSSPGPVDAVWGARPGSIRAVDGGATSWSTLDASRYGSLWVVGDPALLGADGRRWIERFAAATGRGIFWAPGAAGGELAGLRAPAGGGVAPASPALTGAGRRWLEGIVGEIGDAPDGTDAFPPIEALPAERPPLPAGATVLLQAGGRPVAWSVERAGNRVVVALGTGWYRLALGGSGREEAGRRFWDAWTEATGRWLAAAGAAQRALVEVPEGGRLAAGVPFALPVAPDAGALAWRIVPAEGGEPAAAGRIAAGDSAIAAPALGSGAWRLEVDGARGRERHALAVERRTPDLARTEADTASLAAAARASGGAVLSDPGATIAAPATTGSAPTRVVALGLLPWAFLASAVLLLAHWAVAARAR